MRRTTTSPTPLPRQQSLKDIVSEFATTLESMIEARVAELAQQRAVYAIQNAFARTPSGSLLRRRPPSPGRQLQGRYIGRLRKLKGSARAQVQKVARQDGIAAAIELAEKLLATA